MKKKIIICDICHEQFSPYRNEWAKLKIRNEGCNNVDDFEFRKWDKWDLCPKCARHLLDEVFNMRSDTDDNKVR